MADSDDTNDDSINETNDDADARSDDGANDRPSPGKDAPFIPHRDERPAILPRQRPDRPSTALAVMQERSDEWARHRTFNVRRPVSDALLRWLVVLVPLALAALAGLLGLAFQEHAESLDASGISANLGGHLHRVRQLTASMGAIGVVGLVAMALWSALMVANTNRVGYSLRTAWFAAAGWLVAPGLGLAAHLTLDKKLDSGSLVGLTVFLAVLYLPFGTLGGAAHDLGGSQHLARTWFLASVLGAFMLIVGMTGATSALPVDNPDNILKIRAFACYVAALLLISSSALAFTTAHNLNALIDHRWAKDDDPDGAMQDPKRMTKRRPARAARQRLTPTLFLRVIVTVGLLGTGLVSVAVMFVSRSRYLRLDAVADRAERQSVVDDHVTTLSMIAAVSVAVHLAYVIWATLAARNAYRRSIMAPTPLAVVSSFLLGPITAGTGFLLNGPFGAAVLVVGLVMTVCGYIVGQLVLGRTVASLGGRGRIFLTWMLVDIGMGVFAAFISANSTNRIQIVVLGVAQTAMALIGASLAWTAMTRLDRTIRAYRHSGAISDGAAAGEPVVTPPPSTIASSASRTAVPAGGVTVAVTAVEAETGDPQSAGSLAFTSSQS
ncbi:MAG: hypothetical protein ABIW84_02400 [Ilumatobacteraceae bacterium]